MPASGIPLANFYTDSKHHGKEKSFILDVDRKDWRCGNFQPNEETNNVDKKLQGR